MTDDRSPIERERERLRVELAGYDAQLDAIEKRLAGFGRGHALELERDRRRLYTHRAGIQVELDALERTVDEAP